MSTTTRGIVAFLLIAFGLTWASWAVAFFALGLTPKDNLYLLANLPAMFAPAIAAIVVRKWVTREGFADAGLRLNLRRGWRYYLFGFLLPLLMAVIVVVLAVLLGVGRPDLYFVRGLSGPVLGLALIGVIVATPLMWGEEFGWRGYLQIRLFADRPLLASVATGASWGVWHYPQILLTGLNYPDHPILGLFVFAVFTVLVSIVFGWLRLRTGSTWAPSLAHSSIDSVGEPLLRGLFPGSSAIQLSIGGVLALVSIGTLCVWIVFTGQLRVRLSEPPEPEPAAVSPAG